MLKVSEIMYYRHGIKPPSLLDQFRMSDHLIIVMELSLAWLVDHKQLQIILLCLNLFEDGLPLHF